MHSFNCRILPNNGRGCSKLPALQLPASSIQVQEGTPALAQMPREHFLPRTVSHSPRNSYEEAVYSVHMLFTIFRMVHFSLIIRPWQIFGKSSREFLTDFISLYESFPCIWRVKSKEYSDRDKKGGAYERLVEKFKEIDVNASRETVAKKINSLRSVYRKELAKKLDNTTPSRSSRSLCHITTPHNKYLTLRSMKQLGKFRQFHESSHSKVNKMYRHAPTKHLPNLPLEPTSSMMLWVWLVAMMMLCQVKAQSSMPLDRSVRSHQISPKPCSVNGLEGTCMFVWECIKTEGRHVGMCVDAFMFGSCCAHNLTDNQIARLPPASGGGSAPLITRWSHHQYRPSHDNMVDPLASSASSSSSSSSSSSYNHKHSTPFVTKGKPKPHHSNHFHHQSRPNHSRPVRPVPMTSSSSPPSTSSTPSPTTRRPTTTTTTSRPTTTTTTTTTTSRPTTTTKRTSTSPKPPPSTTTEASTTVKVPTPKPHKKPPGTVPASRDKKKLTFISPPDKARRCWVSVRRVSFFGTSSTHRCGGALLNEQWIATAGHCVDDLMKSQIRIRVGEYDFSTMSEPYPFAERSVTRKVVHPNYNYFTYEYDLALVRLDAALEFAPHIAPICLPGSDDLLIGENATVTGWGRLSEGGTLPSVLQEVTVPIVSNDKCKNMFLRAGRHEFIPDIFMCAGFDDGGRDSCQGDSGGPLQVRGRDGRFFLAGIISWGIGCAEANLPGVCTRISKFVPWILDVMNNDTSVT
uniref:Serine protease 3 n=1 Tax=Nilaparvata lugens TaxID=108931 RepID=A0A068FB76_NILLU|nr:serine protease 3 [Nilaparvata lugens]